MHAVYLLIIKYGGSDSICFVDSGSPPVEGLLVGGRQVVSVALASIEATYLTLLGRKGDLRPLAQTFDARILLLHQVIVRRLIELVRRPKARLREV